MNDTQYNANILCEDIYSSIIKQKMFIKNNHLVIIGNNSSGKTSFAKLILTRAKNDKLEDFYYIDPNNRYIQDLNGQGSSDSFADFSALEILENRTRGDYYTKKDVFSKTASDREGSCIAFNELCGEFDNYKLIIESYFPWIIHKEEITGVNHRYNIEIESNGNRRDLNTLSNSELAMMRVLMEVEYASKSGCKTVLIDEFDIYLDITSVECFLTFLINTYPQMRFIVIIHNVEVLINLKNIDVLLISKSNIDEGEIWADKLDGNDLDEIRKLDRIIHRYNTNKSRPNEQFLSNCITELVKRGELSNGLFLEYQKIDTTKISVRERIMYDYIKGLLPNEVRTTCKLFNRLSRKE